MKFFGKVSLVFKYISRLFRLDPGYFMLSVFSQICNAAAAVLMLWLPKIILDEFVGDRNITKIIICVAVMAVSAIFICVVEKITETLGFRLSHLQNHVRIERTSKMAELDMAQVESPAVHDLSALAAEVNNRGTINQVTNRVMGLFSAIPMLITTIIILAEVNLWLVPISVVFAVASVIVSAHIEKRVFENHMYSETLFRAENYFAGVFSNKDFRKEIRFFRIHDWLVAKHEKKYGELLANEQKLNNYVAGVTAPVENKGLRDIPLSRVPRARREDHYRYVHTGLSGDGTADGVDKERHGFFHVFHERIEVYPRVGRLHGVEIEHRELEGRRAYKGNPCL